MLRLRREDYDAKTDLLRPAAKTQCGQRQAKMAPVMRP